jgi:antitoxin MazE
VKIDIIRIGNSRGLRLPKAVLEQAGVSDAVDVVVDGDRIVLTALRDPPPVRAGWDAAFAAAGDQEALSGDEAPSAFDMAEWEW